ncbi:hypothetical protein HC776_01740 [bacterium]|nr:hypothetical protein [bacterium]
MMGVIGVLVLGLFAFALPAAPLDAQFMTNTPVAASLGVSVPPVAATQAAVQATPLLAASATPLIAQSSVVIVATPSLQSGEGGGGVQPAIYNALECRYVEGQPTSDACIALMERYPEPNVTDIQPDGYTLAQYSFWKLQPGQEVTKFDVPGGNPVGTIPVGFNFINAVNTTVEGWLEVEGGGWIQRELATPRSASYFTG